ncbi:MAG: ferritin-like domain-containing protein [Bacillota bacterium]|nr:ferritin-like domain-containing protein [Bacillota bacterium]
MDNRELLHSLAQGLCAQKRAVKVMELMENAAPEPRDKQLLAAIRREERRHYYLLEGIYEETALAAYQPPRLSLSLPRHYPQMLKTAICDKLAAVEFYQSLLPALVCYKLRDMLELIISEQKEHARLLAAVYARCADGMANR